MITTTLPYRAPVLAPEQICTGRLNNPDGTHCLLGWLGVIFGRPRNLMESAAYRAVTYEIPNDDDGGVQVAIWNDEHTPEERAALWARAMKRLGYVREGAEYVLPELAAEAR